MDTEKTLYRVHFGDNECFVFLTEQDCEAVNALLLARTNDDWGVEPIESVTEVPELLSLLKDK